MIFFSILTPVLRADPLSFFFFIILLMYKHYTLLERYFCTISVGADIHVFFISMYTPKCLKIYTSMLYKPSKK